MTFLLFINDGLYSPEVFPSPWTEETAPGRGVMGAEHVGRAQRGSGGVGEQEVKPGNIISPLIYNV